MKLRDLLGEQLDSAVRRKVLQMKSLGTATNHIERVHADGASRAEESRFNHDYAD